MLTQKEALRLRSIGRFASKAKTDIELANMLGVSPNTATAALRTIRQLVGLLPPIKRGRRKKHEIEKQLSA